MYARIFIFFLFVSLGLAYPVFPVARPYTSSGLGPVPNYTTDIFISSRGLVNPEGEIITGPIPDKWKHTHGVLPPEIKAGKRSMNGDCGEGIACASLIDSLLDLKDKLEDELKEHMPDQLDDRDLEDCKSWMWGC